MEKSINQQVASLKKRISNLQKKLEKVQNSCLHKSKQNNGDSNNDDGWSINVKVTWWTHFYCPDCEKGWSEEH